MRPGLERQGGFSLPVTLIMMLVMIMLSIMLVRAVDSTNQVINNITYKQAGLAAADAGTETAIAWLAANDALLSADQSNLGYYASTVVPLTTNSFIDFTATVTAADTTDDVDWWSPRTAALPVKAGIVGTQVNNNSISYVIHRLCAAAGAPDPATCVTASSATASGGGPKGAGGFGAITTTANQVAYRITTRTSGPKNTVSYVQTIVMKPY